MNQLTFDSWGEKYFDTFKSFFNSQNCEHTTDKKIYVNIAPPLDISEKNLRHWIHITI